jgi:hypothetical protein
VSEMVPPQFLPWMRRGLAAHIEGTAHGGRATASVTVVARASGTAGDDSDDVAGPPIQLYGPGDVLGIDQAEVVRHDPEAGAEDAEDNYFALVELASPDLPWRFTPAGVEDDRLRPWIALVVVEETPETWLEVQTGARLPVLHVADVAAELPDLDQAWAWAHVTASHDLQPSVEAAFDAEPAAFRARLMCPRRLAPNRPWIACVVPTFEAGRVAGLAIGPESDRVLSWETGESGGRDVPVYHSWRFRTGASGDFEALVRRLKPRELAGSVGRRNLDISDPGSGIPRAPGIVVSYQGALLSPAGEPLEWDTDHRARLTDELRTRLNRQLARGEIPEQYSALEHDPVVGPPAYAAAQARARRVPAQGQLPVWFGELNTEPPHRVVAALGADVVRHDQEELMAAAWDHAASVRDVNATLTAARLAYEVGTRVVARLGTLSGERLVQLAAPAAPRLRSSTGGTVAAGIADAARRGEFPAGVVGGPLRRLTNTMPAMRGRRGVTRARAGVRTIDTFTRAVLDDPVGMMTKWGPNRPPPTTLTPTAAAQLRSTRRAVSGSGRQRRVIDLGRLDVPIMDKNVEVPDPRPGGTGTTSIGSLEDDVRRALDPPAVVVAMVDARVRGLPVDRDHPVPARTFVRPRFTMPTYERLRALSVEYLVPGVGDVPEDTLGLLEPNQAFIEAFMAGVNHEMAREFLWREYPARLDGTWFQRFWDTGRGGGNDIAVIRGWDRASGLGSNRPDDVPGAGLVLLLKGLLPRRYPDLRVYATQATWVDGARREHIDAGADTQLPLFSGRLAPGVYFYGFDLTEEQARGSTDEDDEEPGYFFVLEEQPWAARFGLDQPKQLHREQPPREWSDLSWAHLAAEKGPLPTFVDVDGPAWLVGVERTGNGGRDMWGDDAAAMARITLQRPVRMLVHADSMLPPRTRPRLPDIDFDLPWDGRPPIDRLRDRIDVVRRRRPAR